MNYLNASLAMEAAAFTYCAPGYTVCPKGVFIYWVQNQVETAKCT